MALCAAQPQKQPIAWINGMRALGILFVFFAHDGLSGGPMLLTISYTCSVPLFFFTSGLFASKNKLPSLGKHALDSCRKLLLPYAVYSVATLLICTALNPALLSRFGHELLNILLGRRNHLFAAAAWFLPCMFVLGCVYHPILRHIPNRFLRLALAAAISLPARLFLEEPMLPFSINAALRYLIYYALGDALSELLTDSVPNRRNKITRWSLGIIGSVVFLVFACGLYNKWLSLVLYSTPAVILLNFCFALSAIAAAALCGALLGRIPFIGYIGRSTLICCGTESIARPLLTWLLSLFGIGLAPGSALGRIAMNLLVIAFITLFFTVPIQRFAPWLAGRKYTPRNKLN